MKLAVNTKSEVVQSEAFEENSFKIQAGTHAFKILSEGLYTHKIRAVIRELSCNAADAHKEVSNLAPFEVHLPTPFNSFFSVKDYGPGLSHDGVMNLYTTYFQSSKSHDNSTTGGFGLGSKSPFAYATSFEVTSRFEGNKRTYVAFVTDVGAPSIKLLHAADTNEPSGLEVKVSVKPKDISEFLAEASIVYDAFDVKPTFTGAKLPIKTEKSEIFLQGSDWTLYKQALDRYGYACGAERSRIVMGNVAYPFPQDIGDVKLNNLVHNNTVFVVLKVPVGFVIPTPSRESLSLTKPVAAAIRRKLISISEGIGGMFTQKLDACKNMMEARQLSIRLTTSLDVHIRNVLTMAYKGKVIEHSLSVNDVLSQDPSLKEEETLILRKYTSRQNYRPGAKNPIIVSMDEVGHKHSSIRPEEGDIFLLGEVKGKPVDARIRDWIRSENSLQNKRVYLVIPGSEKIKQAFLDWLGCDESCTKSLDEVPKHTTTATARGPRRGPGQALAYGLKNCFSQNHEAWDQKEIDVNVDSGIYLPIHAWQGVLSRYHDGSPSAIISTETIQSSLKLLSRLDNYLGLGIKVDSFVGVKTSNISKFEGSPNWTNLKSVVTATLDALAKDQRFLEYLSKEFYIREQSPLLAYFQTIQKASDVGSLMTLNEALNIRDSITQCVINGNNIKFVDIKNYANDLSTNFQSPTWPQVIQSQKRSNVEKLEVLITRYPMIKALFNETHSSWIKPETVKACVNYVKLIDSTQT